MDALKLLLFLLIFSFAVGCSNTKSSEFNPISFNEELLVKNLKKVDKSTLESWGLHDYALNYRNYEYYRELEGEFKPLVMRVSGDDYFALVLYTFDEQGKILSEYEISGGQCAGPTELENKIEFCSKRTSTMISPTVFIIKSVQRFYADWEDIETNKPVEIDSTQWQIKIDPSGKIVEMK